MAWTILYDPEQHIAALVDPDAPAALGPVAVGSPGEDPRLPLQEFVDGLEQPPDKIATWPLFNEWASYVRAIVDLVEAEVEAAQERPDAPEGTEPPSGGDETPQAPAGEATAPESAPPAPATPDDGGETGGDEDPELSARIHNAPGTPAKSGREECWMCHGDLQIDGPNGRVSCPVCHGEGTVTVEAAS